MSAWSRRLKEPFSSLTRPARHQRDDGFTYPRLVESQVQKDAKRCVPGDCAQDPPFESGQTAVDDPSAHAALANVRR